MTSTVTLLGDGIENPANVRTLDNAASMFGAHAVIRTRDGHRSAASAQRAAVGTPDGPSIDSYQPLIALENGAGAEDIYGFRLPKGPSPALVVGNEQRGIRAEVLALAHKRVQIPMAGRKLNTLNVGAAAAVGLYYLANDSRAAKASAAPSRRRPELALLAPRDHVEAGSSLRSAGAFAWERVLLDDRLGVWFGADRARKNEGRAAARLPRNTIRVIPIAPDSNHFFDKVCVVTVRAAARELSRANLARGAGQVIVIPDEDCIDVLAEDWQRFGRSVEFVGFQPPGAWTYQYRLVASVAMAEVARQVGRRLRTTQGRRIRARPYYDSSLDWTAGTQGQIVPLAELQHY